MELLTLGRWLKRRYGCRVRKLSVDAGMTCPNIDGTKAAGGCAFCDNRAFSPAASETDRAGRLPPVADQLTAGIASAPPDQLFIAYFQPHTNTYAPTERLIALWDEAFAVSDRIIGIAVGTRPDCVSDTALAGLERLAAAGRHIWLELGLQTVRDATRIALNCGYTTADFDSTVARAQGRGLFLCAHLIFGLPGETRDDMLASVDHIARLGLDGVKFHQLQIYQDAPIADRYRREPFPLLEPDEYVDWVAEAIRRLPSGTVIQRFMAEAAPGRAIAPNWQVSKPEILARIQARLSSLPPAPGRD